MYSDWSCVQAFQLNNKRPTESTLETRTPPEERRKSVSRAIALPTAKSCARVDLSVIFLGELIEDFPCIGCDLFRFQRDAIASQ